MSTLFISDLHLEDSQPGTLALLLDFLSGPARSADAVYILGDLFEYWIGDDALSSSAREVASSTSTLNRLGIPCYFIHGNRDFMLGPAYAEMAGLTLLPETQVVDLYGKPTLLLHGDTLCTDDLEYQKLRIQLRNPEWQAAILALSVEERLKMAQDARDASMKHTGAASEDIMDVNEDTVTAAFGEHGVDRMIHGHTHRPAFHRHALPDGREAERLVLADWYRTGSYLQVSREGYQSIKI